MAVADTGNNRIAVLDAEGNFMNRVHRAQRWLYGVVQLPARVAVEMDGDLVVADTGNQRVVTVLRAQYRLYLPLVLNAYSPAGAGCQELIQNGGFEDDTAWVIGATPRPARFTTEQAHAGNRSILLGLKPGEGDLYSYSSSGRLSLCRQPSTAPPCPSGTILFLT